jgi:pyridoxal phosphate enzyme (YggS family)
VSLEKKGLYAQKLKEIQSLLPSDSHLLIVSKTRSVEEIKIYYDLGHRDFGENRVQELSEKATLLQAECPDLRWHMIGNLQSNKLNQLFSIPHLWAIHSVNSRDLLDKMLKVESRLDHPVELFLQVNTSREEEKSGFEDYATLKSSAEAVAGSTRLKVRGLMTMGTLRTEQFEVEARRCFQELGSLKNRLSEDLGVKLETSMGMSQDYKIALEEKSHWIRLGTMMFEFGR